MMVHDHAEAGWSVPGAALLLELTALFLRLDPALLRPAGRLRPAATRRRRGERGTEDGGQPLAGGLPAAQLLTVLARGDRQDAVDQAVLQPVREAPLLVFGQPRDLERRHRQLHP